MSVHYKISNGFLLIVGHTYPHREAIRNLGAFFDRQDKVWKLDYNETTLSNLEAFCRNLGGGKLDHAPSPPPPPPTPRVELPSALAQSSAAPLGLTIKELIDQTQLAIARAFPSSVWVIGEVQNANHRGGAIFFNIVEPKESNSNATLSVNAVVWTNTLKKLPQKINATTDLFSDGMKIRVLCQVNLYRDRGSISLQVIDVDPIFTKGAIALAREALLKELRQMGLDRKNKEQPLTHFPLRIGLISAAGSRAQSDFIDQLTVYQYSGTVVFYSAMMQGERTSREVIAGIQALVHQDVDCIVITRGGGSAADLRWFDERNMAIAIANCPVPIIAAIGHHEDVCIAEQICHHREKTPTAAADFFVSRLQQTQTMITTFAQRISALAERQVTSYQKQLSMLREYLILASIKFIERRQDSLSNLKQSLSERGLRLLQQIEHGLLKAQQNLGQAVIVKLAELDYRLKTLATQLDARDPRPWLEKGWTQLYLDGGKLLKSVRDVDIGQSLRARLFDGQVQLDVKNVKVNEDVSHE